MRTSFVLIMAAFLVLLSSPSNARDGILKSVSGYEISMHASLDDVSPGRAIWLADETPVTTIGGNSNFLKIRVTKSGKTGWVLRSKVVLLDGPTAESIASKFVKGSEINISSRTNLADEKLVKFDRLAVVTNLEGAIQNGESGDAKLPFGSAVETIERFGTAVIARRHEGELLAESVLFAGDIRVCRETTDKEMGIQACLKVAGYNIGKIDGVIGPKTKGAIETYLTKLGVEVSAVPSQCLAQVICSEAGSSQPSVRRARERFGDFLGVAVLPENIRSQRNRAVHLNANDDCLGLENVPPVVLVGFNVEGCLSRVQEKERKIRIDEETRVAKSAYQRRECSQLREFEPEVQEKYPFEECVAEKEKEANLALFEGAIREGKCDKASDLSKVLGFGAEKVVECRDKIELKALQESFNLAMAQGDCDLLAKIENRLELRGSAEQCEFNLVMRSDSAQRMLLAAAKYVASDERAKAKLVFIEIMDRFPEDSLAATAATQLISLENLDHSEQIRRETEAEMARLKRETEAAQRKAEEARRQMERVRADAERRAAANANSNRRSGPCARISMGYSYPYGVQAFGLNLPQGDARVIGLNPQAGTALVQFLPAGSSSYTQHVRCSNIP